MSSLRRNPLIVEWRLKQESAEVQPQSGQTPSAIALKEHAEYTEMLIIPDASAMTYVQIPLSRAPHFASNIRTAQHPLH